MGQANLNILGTNRENNLLYPCQHKRKFSLAEEAETLVPFGSVLNSVCDDSFSICLLLFSSKCGALIFLDLTVTRYVVLGVNPATRQTTRKNPTFTFPFSHVPLHAVWQLFTLSKAKKLTFRSGDEPYTDWGGMSQQLNCLCDLPVMVCRYTPGLTVLISTLFTQTTC